MQSELRELYERKGKIVATGRSILDKAKAEKRELTAEERTNHDKAIDDILNLDDQINREIKQRDAERKELAGRKGAEDEREERDPTKNDPEEQRAIHKQLRERGIDVDKLSERAQSRSTPAYERAFRAQFGATSQHELRGLTMGLDAEGGYTVTPVQMAAGIIKNLDDEVFVRRFATKQTVEKAASLGVLRNVADPADFDWTTELLTGTEDTSTSLGKREFTPHPAAKQQKVSKKLIRASSMDIVGYVIGRLSYKRGITEEKAFLTGTGVQQPLGVFTAHADGIPTSRDVSTDNLTTEITADGLINAKYSIKGGYWPRLRWLFHRDAMKQIAKLKDQNDQYLWLSGMRDGSPGTVLGHPFDVSENAPNTFTTGQYVGLLADWSNYWIVDALDMTVEVLTELYALTNQNGYILRFETDGAPAVAEAFARVKLA